MSFSCDGPCDVYDERTRKARKEHECDACEETIAPGHRYWRIAVIFDGRVTAYKRCLRCQEIHLAIRRKWHEAEEFDMWPDEELACGSTWEEEHNGPPPVEVAELAFVTQDEMQKRSVNETGSDG